MNGTTSRATFIVWPKFAAALMCVSTDVCNSNFLALPKRLNLKIYFNSFCIKFTDLHLPRRSFTANRDILPLFFGIIISLAFLMPFSNVLFTSFSPLTLPPLRRCFFSTGIKIKLIYSAKKHRLPFGYTAEVIMSLDLLFLYRG